MATALATLPWHDELPGSPTEEWPEQGSFKATRVLRCDWSSRANLVLALKGGLSGGTLYVPRDYPHLVGCKCVSAAAGPFSERVTAFGGATSVANYEFAQVTAQYGGNGAGGGGGSNSAGEPISESLEPAVEFMQLPAEGFFWGSTNGTHLKDEEAPGKGFYSLNYVYKRGGMSTIPSSVFTLIGKVNDGTITSYTLGQTFAAETLLYHPPLLERSLNPDGTGSWSITMRFTYKPDGWNRFWRQDKSGGPGWDRIYNKNGPADPYLTGTFTTLLG
jgi:hypothetical protein